APRRGRGVRRGRAAACAAPAYAGRKRASSAPDMTPRAVASGLLLQLPMMTLPQPSLAATHCLPSPSSFGILDEWAECLDSLPPRAERAVEAEQDWVSAYGEAWAGAELH